MVAYRVGTCELTLGLDPAVGQAGACIYWSVDDIDGEYQRLCALGTALVAPCTRYGFSQRIAEIQDPFGNVFGLMSEDSTHRLQAQKRRAEEQAALLKVRSTVDQFLDSEEKEKKNARKVLLTIGAFLSAIAVTFALFNELHPRQKPRGEVTKGAELLRTDKQK
jgi:hypothetical protein